MNCITPVQAIRVTLFSAGSAMITNADAGFVPGAAVRQ